MAAAKKVKISITLSADLVQQIDSVASRDAKRSSRSSVIEAWLRLARRRVAQQALDDATIRYYQSLNEKERSEDEDWSTLSTRAFAELE